MHQEGIPLLSFLCFETLFSDYSSNWFPNTPTLIGSLCARGLIYGVKWQYCSHLWLNWVQCTTQMPMAASPPVCLDGVNTRLYRPADWQSLMIRFVGYEKPGQLKWLTASGILCVCLVGVEAVLDLERLLHRFMAGVRRMRVLHLLRLLWNDQHKYCS